MLFELAMSGRDRKCHMCTRTINKREQHFTLTQYDKELPYPVKKNICKYCAYRITEPEFDKFLTELLVKLRELRAKHKSSMVETEKKERVF